MTVGKTISEEPKGSDKHMAKRLKQTHEPSGSGSSQSQTQTSPATMEAEIDTGDEISPFMKAMLLASRSEMADLNRIEYIRTESDDEPIEPEPVPLSDSELPPRPVSHKKKKKDKKNRVKGHGSSKHKSSAQPSTSAATDSVSMTDDSEPKNVKGN